MGRLFDEHIIKFLIGKTIKGVEDLNGEYRIIFDNGEALKIESRVVQPRNGTSKIIAYPYRSTGDVKTISEIMRGC